MGAIEGGRTEPEGGNGGAEGGGGGAEAGGGIGEAEAGGGGSGTEAGGGGGGGGARSWTELGETVVHSVTSIHFIADINTLVHKHFLSLCCYQNCQGGLHHGVDAAGQIDDRRPHPAAVWRAARLPAPRHQQRRADHRHVPHFRHGGARHQAPDRGGDRAGQSEALRADRRETAGMVVETAGS